MDLFDIRIHLRRWATFSATNFMHSAWRTGMCRTAATLRSPAPLSRHRGLVRKSVQRPWALRLSAD